MVDRGGIGGLAGDGEHHVVLDVAKEIFLGKTLGFASGTEVLVERLRGGEPPPSRPSQGAPQTVLLFSLAWCHFNYSN